MRFCAAIESYVRQRDLSLEAEFAAGELRLRAQRVVGQMLSETERNKGTRLGGNITLPPDTAPTLADLEAGKWLRENVQAGNPQLSNETTIPQGITRDQSSQWQKMNAKPETIGVAQQLCNIGVDVCPLPGH